MKSRKMEERHPLGFGPLRHPNFPTAWKFGLYAGAICLIAVCVWIAIGVNDRVGPWQSPPPPRPMSSTVTGAGSVAASSGSSLVPLVEAAVEPEHSNVTGTADIGRDATGLVASVWLSNVPPGAHALKVNLDGSCGMPGHQDARGTWGELGDATADQTGRIAFQGRLNPLPGKAALEAKDFVGAAVVVFAEPKASLRPGSKAIACGELEPWRGSE